MVWGNRQDVGGGCQRKKAAASRVAVAIAKWGERVVFPGILHFWGDVEQRPCQDETKGVSLMRPRMDVDPSRLSLDFMPTRSILRA